MTPFDPRLPLIAAQAKVKTCHVYHCWQAMREMGRQFHAGAFAAFAGLEDRHVTAIMTALEANDALPERRTAPETRGSRLARDFTMPADWIEWARYERKWSQEDALREAAHFTDYWHSQPGQKAVKVDWRKTWQTWVRNSRRPDGNSTPAAAARSDADNRASLEARAALYEKMGRDVEAAEIRRRLAKTANVIPFQPPLIQAVNQ